MLFHPLKVETPPLNYNNFTKGRLKIFLQSHRKRKRVAGIHHLCYRTRIAIEFNFEFGFGKSNLMRRSFQGDALIEAYMVSSHAAIFQRRQTYNARFLQTQIFLFSFCSVIPSRKEFSESVLITASP